MTHGHRCLTLRIVGRLCRRGCTHEDERISRHWGFHESAELFHRGCGEAEVGLAANESWGERCFAAAPRILAGRRLTVGFRVTLWWRAWGLLLRSPHWRERERCWGQAFGIL